MAADTIALLERALDQTAEVIAAVRPEQSSWPTPCPAWDVGALVRHLAYQRLAGWFGRDPSWAPGAGSIPGPAG